MTLEPAPPRPPTRRVQLDKRAKLVGVRLLQEVSHLVLPCHMQPPVAGVLRARSTAGHGAARCAGCAWRCLPRRSGRTLLASQPLVVPRGGHMLVGWPPCFSARACSAAAPPWQASLAESPGSTQHAPISPRWIRPPLCPPTIYPLPPALPQPADLHRVGVHGYIALPPGHVLLVDRGVLLRQGQRVERQLQQAQRAQQGKHAIAVCPAKPGACRCSSREPAGGALHALEFSGRAGRVFNSQVGRRPHRCSRSPAQPDCCQAFPQPSSEPPNAPLLVPRAPPQSRR